MTRILITVLISLFIFPAPSPAARKKAPTQRIDKLFDVNVEMPTDMAVNNNGNIYAVDGVNNRISVFDGSGRPLFSFGRRGSGKGEFESPVGIGIASNGDLYVADTGNARIQIFDSKGNYKGKFSLKGQGVKPIDVAVDSGRGICYITDNRKHRVAVYTTSGEYIRGWGQRGEQDEDFRYPATIWIHKERIYVADVLNSRAKVYRPDGTFIRQIGKWGVLPGEFFRPKGVAVDSNGRIYIADSYMDVIEVFSGEGRFLHVLGEGGTRIRRFTSPAGIFIKGDRLYVAEMLENRVSVYRLR